MIYLPLELDYLSLDDLSLLFVIAYLVLETDFECNPICENE